MVAWLIAFAATLALEVPVYTLALRRRLGGSRAALLALALNAVTHPSAWWLTRQASWTRYTSVEIGVWLVEAALAWLAGRGALPAGEALLVALVANALSAGVGLLVM